MTLVLRGAFEILVQERRAFIVRRADVSPVAAIEPLEVFVLEVLNRSPSMELCRNDIKAALGNSGLSALQTVTTRLAPLLSEENPTDRRLNFPEFFELRSHVRGLMRTLPGPKVLHWTVTNRCPRQCLYCYAEPVHGSRADDSTISRTRLRTLMLEAAELGATNILLSGSEPFLRPDLPEIIGDAKTAGLEPALTTKHPISWALAKRLADAGMDVLSLSVDTLNPGLSRKLIGSSAYPGQVEHTVANLRRAGLSFAIQAVLTPDTTARIGEVAAFAESHGAIALQLVPFETVRRPILPIEQSSLMVSRSEAERAFESIRRDHPGLNILLFEKAGPEACDELHCDIGATKLFFTPSGRVHRCYKLTEDESLFGLDLNVHSIAQAWHDPVFADKMLPAAAEYIGTPCATCGNNGSCNSSGRCIFQASLDHGKYAAPDRDCGPSRAWVMEQRGSAAIIAASIPP